MHSRPDRDKYIKINYENIVSGLRPQFKIIYETQLFTVFDPRSVMMYGNRTGSLNRTAITMELLDHSKYLIDTEEKYTLSDLDIVAINTLYRCSNQTSRR